MKYFKYKMSFPKFFSRSSAAASAAIFILASATAATERASCLSFEAPLANTVLRAPSPACTVSLRVECENVRSVELHARYTLEDGGFRDTLLGSNMSPPYKLKWDMSALPNQLTGVGIQFRATATIPGAESHTAMRNGIFLTHNKVDYERVAVPYAINAQHNANALKFDLGDGQQKAAHGAIVWNEKGFVVQVAVKDSSFDRNDHGRKSDVGLEIWIDPTRGRLPHPSDSTLVFFVPLTGDPHKFTYRTEVDADGSFRIQPPQSTKIDYTYSVRQIQWRGYEIQLTIPPEAFAGRELPDTVNANLILRTYDNDGKVRDISLSGGNPREMRSPFVWNEFYRVDKPVYMNAWLQLTAFFVIGFLLALALYLLIGKLRRPQHLTTFERSEEDKAAFDRMNDMIERELIRKDLTLEQVAQACRINPQALNTLIRRNTGFTFTGYLQYCRTEVAKERLRSSRSSEKSIADLCGFTSAMEMEKCFLRFHHTTPYKFRMQQQVT